MVSRPGGRPRVTAVEWRVLGLLRQWWHQPDHFDWLSVYVKNRGMHLMWRAGIATETAAKMSEHGQFPRITRIGSKRVVSSVAFDAWLRERIGTPAAAV